MMMRSGACALLAALALAGSASAQVSSPSTAALGMGDNYTGAARGFSALAWNPANLGLMGNPGSSFQFLTVRGIAGVDPVTLSDIKDYQGKLVPADVKAEWLAEIEAEGSQQGTSGFDGNWLSLQIGRFALQASTSGRAVANISPGIARLLLFGNTDNDGNPVAIDLSNSSLDMNAYSTLAVGYAIPFTMSDGASRLSLGITGKYTMGHFVAIGNQSTGGTTTDPTSVTLHFPIIHSPVSDDEGGFDQNSGSGIGLDVGLAYQSGALTAGVAVQNIVNSFEWDADKLYFRQGELLLNKDTTFSSFDSEKLSVARTRTGADAVPAALLARIDDMKFKPVIAAGAAYQASSKLKADADVRLGSADGIRTQPKTHVGAGLEYRLLSWLPVRVGGAFLQLDDDVSGSQIGGGVGIDLGGFNLAASAQRRTTDLGHDAVLMLTIFSRGM